MYRILGLDETLQVGDEYYNLTTGNWVTWSPPVTKHTQTPRYIEDKHIAGCISAFRRPISADKNVESVRTKLAERAIVGLRKYGVTTEREDLTTLEWLNHAQQEAMDSAVYLEKLIQRMTWRDAKADPPKACGDYLVWVRDGVDVATYYPDGDQWGAWQALGHKIGDVVEFWMPLPDKPKGKE